MKTKLALATALALLASPALGFSDLTDAVDGRYFDPDTSTAAGGTLTLGLHTGIDPVKWFRKDFSAGGASNRKVATDAVSVSLEGCPTRATVTVEGTASIANNGAAVASIVLSGGDKPAVVEFVRTQVGQGDWSRTVQVEGACLTNLHLSVALFAHSTPSGNPSIRVTSAEASVE